MKALKTTSIGLLILATGCSMNTGTDGPGADEQARSTSSELSGPFPRPMTDKIGTFFEGLWNLDRNGNGVWEDCNVDLCLNFGTKGDIGVVGDWAGDGVSRIGVFRPSTNQWILDDGNGIYESGKETVFTYNPLGGTVKPVVFAGKPSRPAVFRDGAWRISRQIPPNRLGSDEALFGTAGDLPFTTRYNYGTGDYTKLAVYRPSAGRFLIDNNGDRTNNIGDYSFLLGGSTSIPIAGRFSTSATVFRPVYPNDNFGVFRTWNGSWFFDVDGTLGDNGCTSDNCASGFGNAPGVQPVVGNWPSTTYASIKCGYGYCGVGQTCASVLVQDGINSSHTEARCVCAPGFTPDSTGTSCHDVDECKTGTASCGENTICANEIGTYRCDCAAGGLIDFGATCCPPNSPAVGMKCECGKPGEVCCAPNKAAESCESSSSAPMICGDTGLCEHCGGAAEKCCLEEGVAACNATPSNPMMCREGRCFGCGGFGLPCCTAQPADSIVSEAGCSGNLVCSDQVCVRCERDQLFVDGQCLPLPTSFTCLGNPMDNESSQELLNGIAVHQAATYFQYQYTIVKQDACLPWEGWGGPTPSGLPLCKNARIPQQLKDWGYDHFGDGDIYEDRLYVPLTKTSADRVVVMVYDLDLNPIQWATIDPKEGGWIAVNPANGLLYASVQTSQGTFLKAHSRTKFQPYTPGFDGFWDDYNKTRLPIVGEIKLNWDTSNPYYPPSGDIWIANINMGGFWENVWTQGGAFSPNGVLYYVLDNAVWSSPYTGVHAFNVGLNPSVGYTFDSADEIPLSGGVGFGYMSIQYDPTTLGYRNDELEGAAVYRDEHGTVRVLAILLNNDLYADNATIFSWAVNEP